MKHILILAAAVAVAWSAAGVEPVTVTNFSWLQLGPNQVTPFVGSTSRGDFLVDNNATNGNSVVGDLRWGNYVWIPSRSLTSDATAAYWAGLVFDKPRNVTYVNVQLWGAPLSKGGDREATKQFYIDAIINGKWEQIGSWDFGNSIQHTTVKVPVTSGDYQSIRIRFDANDYIATGWLHGESEYGGPGVRVFEPVGSDTLKPGDKVNWANPTFGTTLVKNLDAPVYWNGDNWSNGSLIHSGSITGVERATATGEYLEIDLTADRLIDSVIAQCHQSYAPGGFTIMVRAEGDEDFHAVKLIGDKFYPAGPGGSLDTIGYDFEAVEARWVRIVDVTLNNSHWGITELMVFGTVVPEPATMSLLGLGALALLRRRK